MNEPIVLPILGDPVDELWEVFLELGERLQVPWTIVGGQMVLLHAIEHGTIPPQVSQDGDVIANIRTAPNGLQQVIAVLDDLNFSLVGIAPDGIAHRYSRPGRSGGRPVVMDVLAPEGVGERADLTTTPPGRTIQVPGGTQALNRTEHVRVQVGGRVGEVPRPSLLGAIIGKARACGIPGNASRHLRDLALLCALIEDPFALSEDLTTSDRRSLKLASALDERTHVAWGLVPETIREEGRTAWAILNEPPR
jgi:hypothetical protein